MKAIQIILILLFALTANTQITGTVFRDFDGDGIKDANEPFLPGVTVNAYGISGTLCGTQVTSGNTAPNYSLSGCGTGQVRIEFLLPNGTSTCINSGSEYSSFSGSVYGTSVQFKNGNSSNVNFAVQNPIDYNVGYATNPTVYIPCYVNGNPTGGGTSGSDSWFVGFPYSNAGTTSPSLVADGTVIGATWGVAFSRHANKIFTSAFMKRHSGMGTGGSGAIYKIDPTTFVPTLFYDMDANGYRTRAANTAPTYGAGSSYNLVGSTQATYLGSIDPLTGQPSGLGVIGTNVQRGLPNSATTPNNDPAAFDQVGKVSLGGIEISDDGKYLFVMNLYDRKLYRLTLNDPFNPTSVTAVIAYSLPTQNCNSGVLRPFALKYYNNKIYVGAVCSGENGGSNTVGGSTDLYAFVFEMTDPKGTATFNSTPIINQALNYAKDAAINWTGPYGLQWYPWTKNTADVLGPDPNFTYPTPMFTDIEFNSRGDMVMAIADRSGYQKSPSNNNNLSGGSTDFYNAGGDIIIAGNDCSGYTLENNGSITSINGQTFTGSTANVGPNSGEFFQGDNWIDAHLETSTGSMISLPGLSEMLITVFDPTGLDEGGVKKLSSTNGTFVTGTGYKLYNNFPNGGKSNGLGEIEYFKPLPPLEIGNRVWLDSDNDGIQDANESGIGSVVLQLWADTNGDNVVDTQVGTTTTDASGNYFFTTANVNMNGATGIKQLTNYEIRLINATGGSQQASLIGYSLTGTNTDGSSNGDVRDNDGSMSSNTATIALTTGAVGQNNHTYDFGFISGPTCTATQTHTTPVCNSNGTAGNAADDYFSFNVTGTITDGGGSYVVKIGAYTSASVTSGSSITVTGNGLAGNPLFAANGTATYTVRVEDSTNSACFAEFTVGPVASCSNCPSPNCGTVTVQKN